MRRPAHIGVLNVEQAASGARFSHAVDVTDVTRQDLDSVRLRMLCHLFVDHLPEQGLDELIGSMSSMYESYHVQTARQLPAAVPTIQATLTGVTDRTSFRIVDE